MIYGSKPQFVAQNSSPQGCNVAFARCGGTAATAMGGWFSSKEHLAGVPNDKHKSRRSII